MNIEVQALTVVSLPGRARDRAASFLIGSAAGGLSYLLPLEVSVLVLVAWLVALAAISSRLARISPSIARARVKR